MRATSIQQSGTATTTSARPKPSGFRNSTEPSTSASVSRIRSSPVTPRCTRPDFELVHDLGGRDVDHLDAVEPVERAAIAALVTGLAQGQPGALEQSGGLVLEPALGRDGDGELCRHHAPLPTAASSRSVWMAEPMAGTSLGAPS